MKIILLGGNSPTNTSWLEAMEAVLKNGYHDVFEHRYSHWDTKAPLVDLDKELEKLQKEIKGIEQYVIVGKSAGALLALKGVSEQKLSPVACVFIGTAVLWGRKEGFDVDKWIKGFSVPTIFIQKLGDPAIASDAFEVLLRESGVKNYKLRVIPGEEHEYSEYQEISQTILSFLRDEKLVH
ncbi:MAG: hypothetical protein Q7R80_03460 [bacterium]|nr:hypothetical protein [bacterium]